jgi:Holliday junction DNA helicase RuvA
MIARLNGRVVENDGSTLLVDVHGVGYEVLVPATVAIELPVSEESIILWIRQVFREDDVSLYGFSTLSQRRLFDLLREVKGCGPKIGLAVIGQLGEEVATSALINQDAKTLARASGVGPRLAERMVLELKDKVGREAFLAKVTTAAKPSSEPDELVDALMGLGYRRPEAERAAEDARKQATGLDQQLRVALKVLQR